MTREEAKDKMDLLEGIEICKSRFKLIDEIYDDHEKTLRDINNLTNKLDKECLELEKQLQDINNRTCDNCKYWNPSQESIFESNGDGYIDCDIVYAESNGTINKSNFGCNKWESK